jgi:hypothetical protein
MESLQLVPAPRALELRGGRAPDGAREAVRLDGSLPPQGYTLEIDEDGVRIGHADGAGLRYAREALRQIRSQSPDGLPGLAIRDWPDFPVRGYMLDVSRDRVPTRSTLERIVELLALVRINQLQLYMEHTFAYRDHPAVWCDASPLTAEDVEWLDARCRDRGIELVANQNCFGHMERWLCHAEYRDRAEAPDGWEPRWGGRRPPSVLAPTPENAEFVLALLRELLPHFTSRRVNIGCDETFELGLGSSRQAVAAHGRGRVYLDHLQRLLAPLHSDGYEVQFWGDVVRSHPDRAGELAGENSVLLAWHYEAPMAEEAIAAIPDAARSLMREFGFRPESLRGFADQVAPFAEADVPFWVCPGTSSWNSLVGRLPNACANLRDAAEVGLARGAGGLLITDWGDNGHLQPPSVSFPPLAYGAAVAWCLESNRSLDPAPLLDAFVFQDAAGELGGALAMLGRAYAGTGLAAINASPLQARLLDRAGLAALGEPDERGVAETLALLAEASDRIGRARPACSDGEIVRREILQAARLARHGAWRIARGAGFPCPDDRALRRDLAEAIEEQRACWLERARPGGLADSLARLEATLAQYPA